MQHNGAIIVIHKMVVKKWSAAGQYIEAATEADARAKMLVYLLEQKLIAPNGGDGGHQNIHR